MRRPHPAEVVAGALAFVAAAVAGQLVVGERSVVDGLSLVVCVGVGGFGWAALARTERQRDDARERRDDLRRRLTDQLMADIEDGATKVFFCGDCPARGTAADFGRSLGEEQQ